MQSSLDWIGLVFFFVMLVLWITFSLIFGLRKKPPKTAEHARDPKSLSGLLLQSVGYALAWTIPRPNFAPIVPMPKWAEIAVTVAALVLAALSLWLMWRAIIVLGKQWAYVARIVEGHRLITEGPYNLVRNPIYTGMFGMRNMDPRPPRGKVAPSVIRRRIRRLPQPRASPHSPVVLAVFARPGPLERMSTCALFLGITIIVLHRLTI